MANIPNSPTYTHGSTGTKPSSSEDYSNGEAVDSEHFDYYLNTEFSKLKALIDWANTIDSDDDGKVDVADTADSATTATNVKGNDIDTDGDGKVNAADSADKVDGNTGNQLLNTGGMNLVSHDLDGGVNNKSEFVALTRVPNVPSGTTLRVNSVSVCDDTFDTPLGLSLVVYDATNDNILKSYTGYDRGEPLDEIDVGGIDLLIAVSNGYFTTAEYDPVSNVSAHIGAQFI